MDYMESVLIVKQQIVDSYWSAIRTFYLTLFRFFKFT